MINKKSNKDKKTKIIKQVMFVIIFLLVCGIIGYFIGFLSGSYFKDFMDAHIKSDSGFIELVKIYVLVLIFFLGYILHMFIHEAGHLVFGLMTGYSFVSFRVGSHTLIKEDNRLKYKKFNIPGTGGQCLMMPPALKNGRFPFVIYNLGGGLMNLIVSILGILIVLFVPNVVFPLNAILVLGGLGGMFAAITNLIPLKIGGIANDGYNILSMIRDEGARKGLYLQLWVNGLLSKGKRIKDIPLEMFKLKEDSDLCNPLISSIKLMEYSWYLDNMNFEKAKQSIDAFVPYLDKIIGVYKNEINCERIFLELVENCDKSFIDDLYDKNLKRYIKAAKYMISKKRLLMAYEAFYNKDKEKALKRYEEAKKLAEKYPIKGDADTELMIMEWIRDKC
jgi:hypothetical protein